MKLEEKEMDVLSRKIKSFVRHAGVDEQRAIFWSLLKETVINDGDGLAWLYDALRRFVEEEFEGK